MRFRGHVARLVSEGGSHAAGCYQEDRDGTDVFFHHTSVPEGEFDNLHENQTVEYELEEGGGGGGGKGPRAASVKPA